MTLPTPSANRLRLAIFIDNLDIGGAQKLLLIQVGAMAATHEILIVNFGPETELSRMLQRAGAKVVSHRLSRLANVVELLRLWREVAAWKPDLIHSHLIYAAVVGSVIARSLGKPHVTTLHNEKTDAIRRSDRIKNAAETLCLSKLTGVAVACGPRVAKAQHSRVGKTPLVTVHNRVMPMVPLSADERKRQRAAAGLGADQIVLLAAGRLVPQKGFDLLIEAFARIAAAEQTSVLLIAGEGSEADALAAQAAKLGLGARLRLMGPLDDLAPTLAIVDVFVLSSRYEGLPLVLLEALAAGLPVVATRVGDIETAVDADSALLVEASDIDALAGAIGQILGDADLRLRLSEGARKASHAYTDIDTFAAELDTVYATARRRHARQR